MPDNPKPSSSNHEGLLVPDTPAPEVLRQRLATLLGRLLAQAWLRSRHQSPELAESESGPEESPRKTKPLTVRDN